MKIPSSTYRIFLFFVMAMCSFQWSAFSQPTVTSIRWYGRHHFPVRQLMEKMPLKVGALFVPSLVDTAKTLLKELYASEGFYAFTIDSVIISRDSDTLSVGLSLHLSEGKPTIIQSIAISGNSVFPAQQIINRMETAEGEPLNLALLESDIRSILTLYTKNGYPFVEITTDSIRLHPEDETALILHIVVNERKAVRLEEIRVEGNTATKTDVIVREARLSSGTLFDEDKIEKVRRRIERLQLFSSVSQPELYIVPGSDSSVLRGGLLLKVREGNSNSFDGVVGYVPASPSGGKGYFTGDLFVAFKNLFGTGRKAMVKWKRENELTQELELHYREPWIFRIPLNLSGMFYQRKQDSAYVKSKVDFRMDYAVSEELSIVGNIANESVYPAASANRFSVFESTILLFGAEILFDSRDNLRNPTEGILYATGIEQGTKTITGPVQFLVLAPDRYFSMNRFSLDAEGYITLFRRQVLMFGAHGRQISSSRLEASDLYQIWGTTTVRGYRENQFFASKIAWANVEYRFLTGRASSLFGFIDGGYLFRPNDPLRGLAGQERTLYGFGIGARVETGLGIMNFSYALGEGDSFSNGKIHVGIMNNF